jgi:hypothetical protein
MSARSKIFGRDGKRIFKTKFSHEGTKAQRKHEAKGICEKNFFVPSSLCGVFGSGLSVLGKHYADPRGDASVRG